MPSIPSIPSGTTQETPPPPGPPATDGLPGVLIVNDQASSLIALSAALETGPWRLVTTNSGLGAFKHLLVEDFAVIVLDVRMPGLDGFEVAEMIRTRPRCAATPIIFCSASAQAPDDQFKGFELGAVDYLLAPVAPRVLRSKVAVFVELHEQKRRLALTIAELQQARRTLEAQNRELQLAATRDTYTGCLNRRGLAQACAAQFEALKAGGELSVIGVEIDCPADAVKVQGHAACDACVRRVARLLTGQLRDCDHLCRWRDEQFVVVLGRTPLAAAALIAERMCEQIRADAGAGRPGEGPASAARVSIGVTSTALGADALDALVSQAQSAIRAARQAGGDTVRCHDPAVPDEAG